MSESKDCAHCYYWRVKEGGLSGFVKHGFCCALTPTHDGWPTTFYTNWCGSFLRGDCDG